MGKILFQNKIYVKKSPTHGYGVFAGKTFRKGEIIEECLIVLAKGKDKELEDYFFDAKGKDGLLMGYGMIYNHSQNENTDYKINMATSIATFKAIKTIKKDEEIFVFYGDDWFNSRNMKEKKR